MTNLVQGWICPDNRIYKRNSLFHMHEFTKCFTRTKYTGKKKRLNESRWEALNSCGFMMNRYMFALLNQAYSTDLLTAYTFSVPIWFFLKKHWIIPEEKLQNVQTTKHFVWWVIVFMPVSQVSFKESSSDENLAESCI